MAEIVRQSVKIMKLKTRPFPISLTRGYEVCHCDSVSPGTCKFYEENHKIPIDPITSKPIVEESMIGLCAIGHCACLKALLGFLEAVNLPFPQLDEAVVR